MARRFVMFLFAFLVTVKCCSQAWRKHDTTKVWVQVLSIHLQVT